LPFLERSLRNGLIHTVLKINKNETMDILSIPFHRYLNIKRAAGDDYIFETEQRPEYLNHVGTIHACYQLALAEATSGEFLLKEFSDLQSDVIPVVRKTEAKYHRPSNGKLFSKAAFDSTDKNVALQELDAKNRTIVKVKVEVFDSQNNKTLTVIFDWFISRIIK
jgi:hypothetical protein